MSVHIRKQLSITFAAFRFRDFRLMWTGNLLSNIGTWMQRVAQPWLVLNLSHSPFLLGLDAFAADIPLLALLLVGGVVADRRSRRTIITISQVVQLTTAGLTAALVFTGHIQVWMVIVFSFVVGTVQAFSVPAYQALIPALVDRRHLGNAIALNSTQFNLSRVVGPVLAGVVMASLGSGWCFALNSLSFLALIYALHAIRMPEGGRAEGEQAGLVAGVRAVFSNRELGSLILIILFSSLFSGPLLTFIPVLARDVYHAGAGGFSFLLSVFGTGALLGAIAIASFETTAASLRAVLLSAAALALAVIGISVAATVTIATPLVFIAGVAFIGCNAIANTRLQAGVPDHLRGRAASLYVLAFRGSLPLGNLLTGLSVGHFGARPALILNGCLALSSLGLVALHGRGRARR
jgi:predicted MFS family arabinose efflux permease